MPRSQQRILHLLSPSLRESFVDDDATQDAVHIVTSMAKKVPFHEQIIPAKYHVRLSSLDSAEFKIQQGMRLSKTEIAKAIEDSPGQVLPEQFRKYLVRLLRGRVRGPRPKPHDGRIGIPPHRRGSGLRGRTETCSRAGSNRARRCKKASGSVLRVNYDLALRGNQRALNNILRLSEQEGLFTDRSDKVRRGGLLVVHQRARSEEEFERMITAPRGTQKLIDRHGNVVSSTEPGWIPPLLAPSPRNTIQGKSNWFRSPSRRHRVVSNGRPKIPLHQSRTTR